MTNVIHPFQLLAIALAGRLNRHQQAVIEYLIEENRVLKDQLDGQRLRFTDEQRIRLALLLVGRGGHRPLLSTRDGLCDIQRQSYTRISSALPRNCYR